MKFKTSLVLVGLLLCSCLLVSVGPVSALDTLYEQDTTGDGSGGWYGADNAIVFRATSTHTVTAGAISCTSSNTGFTGYFYLREVSETTKLPIGVNLGGTASITGAAGSGWKTSNTAYMGTVQSGMLYALIFHISSGNPAAYNHYPTAPQGYRYSTDGGSTWLGSYAWNWMFKVYGTASVVDFTIAGQTSTIKGLETTLYVNVTSGAAMSGYIHSINYGNGTFYNTTWAAFSSAPYWANYTFTLSEPVGAAFQWKLFVNLSGGSWFVSNPLLFTEQVQITISYTDGGSVLLNGTQVSSGYSVLYSSSQGVSLIGLAGGGYTFVQFDYTGELEGTTTDNPLYFASTDTLSFWAFFEADSGGGEGGGLDLSLTVALMFFVGVVVVVCLLLLTRAKRQH